MIQILECVVLVFIACAILYACSSFLYAIFELVLTLVVGVVSFFGEMLMAFLEFVMFLIYQGMKGFRNMIKPRSEREFKIRKWEDKE